LDGSGLQPFKSIVVSIPGALRQADMDRASGPLEMVPIVNLHLIEEAKAPLHPIVSFHLEV
jgi:hypothetical protein